MADEEKQEQAVPERVTFKVFHKDATGCSFGGENYEPDDTGAFNVPVEAIPVLKCMGFTTEAPEADAAPAVTLTGNPAKWTKDVLISEAVRLGLDTAIDRPSLVKQVAAARKAEADAAYTEAEAE